MIYKAIFQAINRLSKRFQGFSVVANSAGLSKYRFDYYRYSGGKSYQAAEGT